MGTCGQCGAIGPWDYVPHIADSVHQRLCLAIQLWNTRKEPKP